MDSATEKKTARKGKGETVGQEPTRFPGDRECLENPAWSKIT
jgi:hypothetical protein